MTNNATGALVHELFFRLWRRRKVVNDLLNRFATRGIETFLITRKSERSRADNPYYAPLEPAVRVYQNTFLNPFDYLRRPHVFVLRLFQYLIAATQVGFFLRKNKIDVIHLHIVSFDVVLLILYKYLLRYKLVITFTGSDVHLAAKNNLAGLKVRLALRHADCVTAVSQNLCATLAAQFETQCAGKIAYLELPVEDGRGFTALPQRSRGDVILDLEGHSFFDPARGLTFLFGILTIDGATPRYQPFWAHDYAGERRAFENFIDFVHARLARHPDLHVYHFGAYEQSAIKQLMGGHATRESQVDNLLRRKIFVDLYSIFRQALRAGVSSYSLKKLEPIFEFTRVAAVRSGMGAIVEYEQWRESQDNKFLDQIAAYNEEDCRATFALLDWLHQLRPRDLSWPELPEPRVISEERAEALDARQRLREQLVEGVEPGNYRWLAGELLEYHRREARPGWWWYFERCGMTPEELVEDSESIGCLEPADNASPEQRKRSLVHTLKFPPQDHKLSRGSAVDPATGEAAGEILEIDDATGTLKLLRGPKLSGAALPKSLISGGPYDDTQQRLALFRLAKSIHKGEGSYPALEAILKRKQPRIRGLATGGRVHTIDMSEIKSHALALNSSCLFIQGPPAAGKTWAGARVIAHLLENGKRVGVAAQSHKAIHNLLNEIEKVARETGLSFRGVKKSSDNTESTYDGDFIKSESQFNSIIEAAERNQLLARHGLAFLAS